LPVPLPFLVMDDGHVIEILRNLSLAPHLLEECSLQNFRFLCQQCCANRAEQRCGPFDTRAIVGLNGVEKVFHFIAVRMPLDFLSLSEHPGILHLPQPLLYKAPASEEGSFGGVSPNVHDLVDTIPAEEPYTRIPLLIVFHLFRAHPLNSPI
uniref:DUF4206 domain-containing protein n=1 Tax=Schistocephalus solidus TaxID=70667 RepID=A0A183TDN4_SCHSO